MKFAFCIYGIAVVTVAYCSALSATETSDALPATRLNLSRHDAPTSTTVITREEIQQRGYRNIPDIFRSVPGFRVSQSSGGSFYVSYHGYGTAYSRRMAIAVDGVPIMQAEIPSIWWYRLPIAIDDIAKVVVTRGTNVASLGDNAFLASINFITTSPQDDYHDVTVTSEYGSQHDAKGLVRGQGRWGATDFVASVSSDSTRGFDEDEQGENRDDDVGVLRLNAKSTTQIDSTTRLELHAATLKSQRDSKIDAFGVTDTDPVKSRVHVLGATWAQDISSTESVDFHLNYSKTEEDFRHTGCYPAMGYYKSIAELYALNPQYAQSILFFETYSGRITADEARLAADFYSTALRYFPQSTQSVCAKFNQDREGWQGEGEVEYRLGWGEMNETIVGANFGKRTATSDTILGGTNERDQFRLFTETAYIFDAETLNFGAMLEKIEHIDGIHLAWRSAWSHHFSASQSVRTELSHSFRTPAMAENERTYVYSPELLTPLPWGPEDTAFAYSSKGRGSDTPETIQSVAIGYLFTPSSRDISVDAKVFHNTIDHSLSDPIFISIPVSSVPRERFETQGFEVEFTVRPSASWRADVVYSYLENSSDSVYERSLHSRHAGNAGVTYMATDTQSIGIYYYGNSALSGLTYDRIDATWSMRFTPLDSTLQVGVQHLAGRTVGIDNGYPNGGIYSVNDYANLYFIKLTFGFD